jgi:NADPH:quinone reductase-like Zn-dependent oxidoreductase
MKRIVVAKPGGLDNLKLMAGEKTPPGRGEIQVEVKASSLNFHDYLVVKGMIPTPDGRIPMSDGAGIVSAVGDGVVDFRPGDAVVSLFFPHWRGGAPHLDELRGVPGDHADGFASSFVTAPASAFTRAPAGFTHAQAATLTCAGLTAWRALVTDGNLKSGHTVLVQGTGGVSIFALQFAKAAGASVIATSSSDEKLERLRGLGADHVINYKSNPEWGAEALKLTGGRGVDHVIEIGGGGTIGQSVMASRIGGHIAVIGVLAGYGMEIPVTAFIGKQLRVIGLAVGNRHEQMDMIRAIEACHLRPVIDRHFPLEQIADAFRYQESGKHFGKICLDID